MASSLRRIANVAPKTQSLTSIASAAPSLVRPSLVAVGRRHQSAASNAAAKRSPSPSLSIEQSNTHTTAAAAAVRVVKKSAKPAPLEKKASLLTDEEVLTAVEKGQVRFFNLENDLEDYERAVKIRRLLVEQKTGKKIDKLPYQNYNYAQIHGQCCENVIGVVGIPVGVAGPLLVDGKEYFIPMATTEGALIASTTRGCKAISVCGGVHTELTADGMTRAPVLSTPSVKVANEIKQYINDNFDAFAKAFSTTTRFGKLREMKCHIAGRKLFIRFKCTTGDAMGMNMVGKGVDHALSVITDKFEGVSVLALSGNVCTDKKPSAINWIEGRGKSLSCEAIIKGDVVESVLKTTVAALVEVNYAKNFIGSAMAGSIGGLNAHSANMVAAIFLACGQDPAQVVESSTCMTIMEPVNDGKDLYVSVNMPSLEVGTVGGGTNLPGQAAMLELLGVKGSHPTSPGQNASTLARVIASCVMAGELSLMSALSSGHLISSHLALNRAKPGHSTHTAPATPAVTLPELSATLAAAGVVMPQAK